MRICQCPKPTRKVKPGKQDWCERCGSYIDPEWVSSDATLNAFFDRLRESVSEPAPWLEPLRQFCQARERAGRDEFGFAYLDRDNPREAIEEAADGANYAFFEVLRNRRKGEDEQIDVALLAAYHFGKAYHALDEMRRKEHGVP